VELEPSYTGNGGACETDEVRLTVVRFAIAAVEFASDHGLTMDNDGAKI